MRWAFFHFETRLDPRGPHSGAEMALIWTARALVDRGHTVTVVGSLGEDVTVDGVRYLRAGGAGEYDIAAGLGRIAGTTDVLVSTLRGDVLEASLADGGIAQRILWANVADVAAVRLPVARLLEIADHLVMVSEDQASLFAAAGVPRARLTVLPNGVDPDVFHPGTPADRVPGRIVFVGALVPDKGVDVLLHAMPLVRALVPAAELVVCGSAGLWGRAPYFDPDAVVRELPYVHFRGALTPTAVADEQRAASVAVVPTPPDRWREAMPLTAIEAQACGTPVIVTRSGGLPETVRDGETGWVVDPLTPPTLATALVTALRDPVRLAAAGRAAAVWGGARFSWARNAGVLEALAGRPERAARPSVALVTTWQQRCGLARYAADLVAAYPRGAVRVFAEVTDDPVTGPAPPVPVDRVWRRGEPLDTLVAAAEVHDVRVVHVNHHGGLFGSRLSPVLRALGARGVRTVVTLHAPNQIDPEIGAIGKAADVVLVHGDGARLEVIANGVPPEKVRVVPHGVRPVATHDATATRAAMGLAPGEKLVASVGFLQPHKGVHEVIRALAALRPRLPLQYLVLGGPPPGDPTGAAYRDWCLAEAERLDVRDAVTIVDQYLPDAVLAEYLHAADVIVLPYQTTWWEASGAAREAMASGRPIVTSPALAFADLGGAVFRTTAAFHLAQAIESVLTAPALADALVAEATRLAESDAWPRVAAEVAAIHDDLAARTRAVASRAPAPGAPRVLFMLREGASRTGGGDFVVADTIATHADPGRVAITCREGGRVGGDFDLVHLFNFSTYDVTHEHARHALEVGLPYVVSAMYEDWPSFKLAAEAQLQRCRARLGLPLTVDLEAYARVHEGEQRDVLTRNQLVAAHARWVIATGASEEARLRRDFPEARTRCIPIAVPERSTGDADAFAAKFGTRDFVLCVGRIEPRKNQLLLLEALADDPVDVVFATGGVAYRTDYLEACQAFRRRGRTLYLPALTDRELAGAYRAARVHVIASWFELPGLVTLEALRAGCPAVASDRGTVRDHLADTIPYAPPDDAPALRRAIAAAGGWDYRTAEERAAGFTVARNVAAWMAVYEDVMATRTTRPGPRRRGLALAAEASL